MTVEGFVEIRENSNACKTRINVLVSLLLKLLLSLGSIDPSSDHRQLQRWMRTETTDQEKCRNLSPRKFSDSLNNKTIFLSH